MLLTEIDHIAIAVKDLEAAIAYYQNAFGATVDHREVVESDGVEEALLKVAESYIQLLTPTRPDSPVAKAIEKRRLSRAISSQQQQNFPFLHGEGNIMKHVAGAVIGLQSLHGQ